MRIGLVVVLLALFSGGCVSTIEAQCDYDYSQVFSTYKTFAWISDDPLIQVPGQHLEVSPLNRKRIVDAIESGLAAKGMQHVAQGEQADFVVSYTVGTRDRLDVQSYPPLYRGPWHWGYPFFGRDVDARVYREGTLSIDIFDGRTHQPVWHGWARKELTESDIKHAADQIPKAVQKILFAFPPPDGEPGC